MNTKGLFTQSVSGRGAASDIAPKCPVYTESFICVRFLCLHVLDKGLETSTLSCFDERVTQGVRLSTYLTS